MYVVKLLLLMGKWQLHVDMETYSLLNYNPHDNNFVDVAHVIVIATIKKHTCILEMTICSDQFSLTLNFVVKTLARLSLLIALMFTS